jgi:hypothetical protein
MDARRVTVDDNDPYDGGGAYATHTTLETEARRTDDTVRAHLSFHSNSDGDVRS